jgi:hypothetical protein
METSSLMIILMRLVKEESNTTRFSHRDIKPHLSCLHLMGRST